MHNLIHILGYILAAVISFPVVIGASLSYGFDANEDAGFDDGQGSLVSSILQSGTSLASEAILSGANPTNVALLQGQTVSTPSLTTGSPTVASATFSSGLVILLIIGAVIFFAVRR